MRRPPRDPWPRDPSDEAKARAHDLVLRSALALLALGLCASTTSACTDCVVDFDYDKEPIDPEIIDALLDGGWPDEFQPNEPVPWPSSVDTVECLTLCRIVDFRYADSLVVPELTMRSCEYDLSGYVPRPNDPDAAAERPLAGWVSCRGESDRHCKGGGGNDDGLSPTFTSGALDDSEGEGRGG